MLSRKIVQPAKHRPPIIFLHPGDTFSLYDTCLLRRCFFHPPVLSLVRNTVNIDSVSSLFDSFNCTRDAKLNRLLIILSFYHSNSFYLINFPPSFFPLFSYRQFIFQLLRFIHDSPFFPPELIQLFFLRPRPVARIIRDQSGL